MPLAPGTRLGPYVVDAPIGTGGMGEVYRATDSNLARAVAIKVLAESMTADGDRLVRFDREAKTLALLNHPNIAQIYGLERSGAQSALVMELIEGETLADRIAQGPIPLDEALAIANQIAGALEAAHERGIVHRDLKPANIKRRPDGQIKVLDFGLAKAMDDGAAAPSHTATLTSPALITGVGMLLGTAAYMAPEQAQGRAVDKRADIWAFGVIVYEMLTGKPLFAGDTVVETLAAVVTKAPDLAVIPSAFRPLLQATLERDPRRRLRDIGDAFRLLESAPPAPPAERPPSRALLIAFGLAALAAGVVAAGAWLRPAPPPARDTRRLEINLPAGAQPDFGMALSPDGRRVAFLVLDAAGDMSAWTRELDAFDARPVRGAEKLATTPLFWSADSRSLGFTTAGGFSKINVVEGGDPIVVSKRGQIGATWNADGTIVFGTNPGRSDGGRIFRVPAAGGEPVPLTVIDTAGGEFAHHHPTFLPDGRRFLYLRAARPPERSGIYVGSTDVAPEKQSTERLIATAHGPAFFVPAAKRSTGHLLYLRDNLLMAQPFDADRVALTGEPTPVASAVGSFIDRALFWASSDGTIVYTTAAPANTRQLTWLDRSGKVLNIAGPAATLSDAAMSPDGGRVAVAIIDLTVASGRSEIWIWDLTRGTQTLFSTGTTSDGAPASPVWSHDGTRLAFVAGRNDLYERPVNALTDARPILHGTASARIRATSWSPDGRFILFDRQSPETGEDVWAVSTADGQAVPLMRSAAAEREAHFSPDGKWIAYTLSESSGQEDVYVTAVASSAPTLKVGGGPWRVSSGGGRSARWRADSREIYYAGSQSMMAVPIFTDGGFTVGPATALPGFGSAVGVLAGRLGFVAASPDGKRFLFARPVDTSATRAPLKVLLNWTPPAAR